ncbi:MAG: SPOR domain-containing protein [Bacteroidota bacterium]
MMRVLLLCVSALLILTSNIYAQSPPEDICLSEQEMKLYTLIDNYRKGSQLHKIPLSLSLCYVAKLHAMDLEHNRTSGETCSIHSWTDQATEFEACCYEKGSADKETCMLNKPKELTGYPGNGYEIITVGATTPEQAMTDWQENSSTYGAVIVNTDDWSKFDWSAIGIAIYGKYTVVWCGERTDDKTVEACTDGEYVLETSFTDKPVAEETTPSREFTPSDIPPPEKINEPIKVSTSGSGNLISLKSGYTYLIYGSYTDLSNAQQGVDLLKADGFTSVNIVEADANGMYRVIIGEYSEEQTARDTKAGLQAGYENVWLLIN